MDAISGLTELDLAVLRLSGAIDGTALQAATLAAAKPMLATARQLVAVSTGNLREHIGIASGHTASSAYANVQVAQSQPGGVAHDAIFLEFGTVHAAARPFMRPAFEVNKDHAAAEFTAALTAQLTSS